MKDRTAVGSPQGSILSPCFWLHQSSTSYYEFDLNKAGLLEKNALDEIRLKGFADDNCHQLVFNKQKIEESDNEELAVWLGFSMKMTRKGLKVDLEKTIQDIRIKTIQNFNEISFLTANVELLLKIWNIYISPIISYHLLGVYLCEKYSEGIAKFEVLQNNFLRRIAKVSYYAKIEELHEMLKVKPIREKAGSLAYNLWEKLEKKDYVPKYKKTRAGNKLEITSILDRLYAEKLSYGKELKNKKTLKKKPKKFSKKSSKNGGTPTIKKLKTLC